MKYVYRFGLVLFFLLAIHFYIQNRYGNISYGATLKTKYQKNYPKDGFQKIDATCFTMITPVGWKHYTGFGNDNIFGYLKTNNGVLLKYDFTITGGANSILDSEEECIRNRIHANCFRKCETDTFYPILNIIEKGLTNHDEYYEYLAKVSVCDSIFYVNYDVGEETRKHSFETIEIQNIPYKLIYPKEGEKGYIGIYDFGRSNFYGENIDSGNKKEIINALKTLEWKEVFGKMTFEDNPY